MVVRAFRIVIVVLYGIGFLAPTGVVQAADPPALEITELFPDPAVPFTDAADEFIELHNPTSKPVNVSGYVVKFGSSLGSSHTLAARTIPAGGYSLIKSGDTNIALANNGSSVALFSPAKVQLGNTLTYKTVKTGFAWAKSSDHTWSWTATPTPGQPNQAGSSLASDVVAESESQPAPALQLTELFPDPVSPQTDAADEFIELYNASSEPVDVAGYIIKTGASLSTKHTLKSGVVPSFGYLSVSSATTKIALANAGSQIALFTPGGQPIGPAIAFPKAKAGAAWALDDSAWVWTTTPTPGTPNLITEPAVQGAATAAKTTKTTTPTTASATSKSRSTTTKAPKATKAPKTTSAPTALAQTTTSPGAQWLLFALVGLTIAYCLYEFRYDLQRFYHRLRGHQAASRPAGPAA